MSKEEEFIPEALLREILFYSFLRALTPLIPIPLVDGMAEGELGRKLFRAVGEAHGRAFLKEELNDLVFEERGCLAGCRGCLATLLLWPLHSLKWVRRLVFTPLEVKRIVDSTSLYWVEAFLVHQILAAGRWPEGESARVGEVLRRVCREVGIGPVRVQIGQAIAGTGRKLVEVFGVLMQRLRRLATPNVPMAVEELKKDPPSQLDSLLQAGLESLRLLPLEYRNRLTESALEGLRVQGPQQVGSDVES